MNLSQDGIKKIHEFYENYCSDLECDGCSTAISNFLNDHDVQHEVICGKVTVKGQPFSPHFWIQVGSRVIDFKLRMWFGEEASIPHGVFNPEQVDVEYNGQVAEISEKARVAINGLINYSKV